LCNVVNQERWSGAARMRGQRRWHRALVSGCVVERCLPEYYRNDLRIYRSALESGFTDEQWQDIMRDG